MRETTPFKNEMLLANAGSGKTYALTTRIIRLLLAGVTVDRIAALTFTRKSAGEFLDELLSRLAHAALDEQERSALAKAVDDTELSKDDCRRILAHVIEHFGNLGMGTIDSFFGRIAKQFPLESGLPEEFVVADTSTLAQARERALAATFAQQTESENGLSAMIDQCRQISRRNGERDVFKALLRQTEALHQLFLDTPPNCSWGERAEIWPVSNPPFPHATDLKTAIDAFEKAVSAENPDLSEDAKEYLEIHLQTLRDLKPGQSWDKNTQSFISRKLGSDPKNNHMQLTRKKTGWVELTEEVRSARTTLLHSLYSEALDQSLIRAQGLYSFIETYESIYSGLIRNAGLISFADITTLLSERAEDLDSNDGLDWRGQVAYRIDQRFDHWLLDEFQDTSRTQWSVLRAFIDEVLMDEGGERSFFYVGDTKQAIYSWRGGEAELFREIFQYYDSIVEAPPLTESWRSSMPVVELVNQVFEGLESRSEEVQLPRATVEKWNHSWNEHLVALPKQEMIGFAQWSSVTKDGDKESNQQFEEVLRIISEVEPIKREVECAVLLRKNQDVGALAAHLQSHGIPVAVEGKSNPCTDNLFGSAVIHALRAIAHPEDTLAGAIVKGLPIASSWGLEPLNDFRERSLRVLAEYGYANLIQEWIDLTEFGKSEDFLIERSEAILNAAEAFDERLGSGDGIDAFLSFVDSLEFQEAESADAIRLMTVHQAKGLGFDMCIVCGLDGKGGTATADELILGPEKNAPRWGLLMPGKDIAEHDSLLSKLKERMQAESKTSDLCNAYVALTRAKRALYVITDELEEKSKATHFGRLMKLTFGEGFETGDPAWFT